MYKSLPGFREFYPEDCYIRNYIFDVWRQTGLVSGFQEYDGPILEPLELFTAKSGDEISKQLFSFEDQGGRKVALRPELTPSLARLVGAKSNGMPKPIKWFNIGENFRYERPQKGRLRSFYQFNADILGETSVGADVEVIGLMIAALKRFGAEAQDFIVRLSDRNIWEYLLESYEVNEEGIGMVLSVLDKMEKISEDKIQEELKNCLGEKADIFYKQAKNLFKIETLEDLRRFLLTSGNEKLMARLKDWEFLIKGLEDLGYADFIKIDLSIVRGLAYYTGFVFEAFQLIGTARALAGGGRYDNLVKKLGYGDLPAVGFAMGDVTLRDFLEIKGILPKYEPKPTVYVVFEEEVAQMAMSAVTLIRNQGLRTEYSLKAQKLDKQIKNAAQSKSKLILIFKEEHFQRKEVIIQNTENKTETIVEVGHLIESIFDKLSK